MEWLPWQDSHETNSRDDYRTVSSGVANTELFVRKSRKTLEKVCLEALLNKGLLLKERICSQREQILSFKSSPKCREPNILC